ncbi:MAG: hypothetical protein H7A23_11050 [Leptospiraceae bacterium]|nr:hypothetical protein [Leptospiraceae bacterium]MCP5495081.1 hypothetical protein [Leptospiraceae bacterium]
MKFLRLSVISFLFIIIITSVVVYGIKFSLARLSVLEDPLYPQEDPKYFKRPLGRQSVWMKLRNVNFRFTDKISLKIDNLVAELTPLTTNGIVNFDDINSFKIDVKEGEAYLKVSVMEHIFKDHIFNYDGSPLRLKSIQLLPPSPNNENLMRLEGELKFGMWLGFEMTGNIKLDKQNNKIIIATEKIKTLGNPFTKPLLGIVGLNLQKLLPVPKGRGIVIEQNKIIVSPYKLFPPPALSGEIIELKGVKDNLYLKFGSPQKIYFPAMPKQNVSNFLFLYKGEVKFGKLYMVDTVLEMIDKDPSDEFDFYLAKYFQTLTRGGQALIQPDRSVVVELPDYSDVFK